MNGAVEKASQRRSRSVVVLTYSVYAPLANGPAALLGSLFEQPRYKRHSGENGNPSFLIFGMPSVVGRTRFGCKGGRS